MTFPIQIDPTSEETERVFHLYKEQESCFPAASPPPKRKWLKRILFPWMLVISIPALVLVICRIPFLILRKVRILYLAYKGEKQFKENYACDPDHALSEYVFIPPAYQEVSTRHERRIIQERENLKKKATQHRQDWEKEPENLDLLVDYAAYTAITSDETGKKQALYMLDQLTQLPTHPTLTYEKLYWNLSVLMSHFSLPNQSLHFEKMAIEKGYQPPKLTYNFKVLLISPLLPVAWSSLYGDIINCWPS
jgi:hypothetical protein